MAKLQASEALHKRGERLHMYLLVVDVKATELYGLSSLISVFPQEFKLDVRFGSTKRGILNFDNPRDVLRRNIISDTFNDKHRLDLFLAGSALTFSKSLRRAKVSSRCFVFSNSTLSLLFERGWILNGA